MVDSVISINLYRQTDTQTDRHTQTERHIDRETHRQRDRQRDTQTQTDRKLIRQAGRQEAVTLSVRQSLGQKGRHAGRQGGWLSVSQSDSLNHAESHYVAMSSFIHVFFTDPPDPPSITVVSSVLSLNITWSSSVEQNIIRILDYRIKVFDAITHKRVRQYNRITSSALVIENLKRNRTYIVVIQARNEVGYGKCTNVSATTLPAGTTN